MDKFRKRGSGDDGMTTIISGKIEKSSITINLLGGLDELNALFGVCIYENHESEPLNITIKKFQEILQQLESFVGYNVEVDFEQIFSEFNSITASYENEKWKTFVKYDGKSSSYLFYANTVCRKIERIACEYNDKNIIKILNRMSFCIYCLARSIHNFL